ncbi:bifunctional Vacuolar fusion protein Mon1/FUZ-MON1-HPS1 [Babesia duncani]|uniref:Bifunctional Vacuolar fusion protein Mon1/FUZ-MON1-HPS1 n=1 Tax=Babesia duncani TaxID=323732 RepID=A0AAD9PKV2_9APIC|nr:bifunctional Vacuolar fusion protein Mon1/FUZ-MON1-HPS1 [Babesia duncani]
MEKVKMDVQIYGCTYAGKPLFSSCKEPDDHLELYGIISAIASKVATLLSDYSETDSLRYITTASHIFVYMERGPLSYFGISKSGNSPLMVYKIMSNFHMQIISILTRGIERALLKKPSYDVQNLMGGTQPIFHKLLDSLNGPLWLLDNLAYEPLPLPPNTRNLLSAFFTDFKTDNILCAFLMVSHRIAAITMAKGKTISSTDIAIVINTVSASKSLKEQENWTPICLSNFNDEAFTYAYIKYIDPEIGIVCISSRGDQEQFHRISRHLSDTIQLMVASKCLDDLRLSLGATPLEFPCGILKQCEIVHVMYASRALGQYFSSSFRPLPFGDCREAVLEAYKTVAELLVDSQIGKMATVSFEVSL